MNGSTLIALQGVTVRFGATVALSDIDFSLHAGERVAQRWSTCG